MSEKCFVSYKGEIKDRMGAVYQRGIALKILEQMDRIRNNSNLTFARRWPQELLQNSVDACGEGRPVRVKIELFDDKVIFSHNGDPFRLDHIMSLINQVSSKKRDNAEAIGRFGTGFMTTYQLSEKVELSGIVMDGGLNPKCFHITLDRSGREHEEITSCIQTAMEELSKVDTAPDAVYDPDDYNTSFVYHLNNNESRERAAVGVEDLKNTVASVLMFSEALEEVDIHDLRSEKGDHYNYVRDSVETVGNTDAKIFSIREKGSDQVQRYMSLRDGDISVALLIDTESSKVLPIPESSPRLYIEFPLIGSERFPFPAIINSRSFNPNEPRSGITLVNNYLSDDARKNRHYMTSAVGIYERLLRILTEVGYGCLENAVLVPDWAPDDQMPGDYVLEMLSQIYNKISKLSLVETREGRISFSDVRLKLIKGDSEEEVNGLKDLEDKVSGILVPVGEEEWCRALEHYPVREGLIIDIDTILSNVNNILRRGFDCDITPPEWLAALADIAFKNDQYRYRVTSGDYAIFMSRDEEEQERHILHRFNDLLKDDFDDEELLLISDSLGQKWKSCIRKHNIFDKAYNLENVDCRKCSKYTIAQGINSAVDNMLRSQSLGDASDREQDSCANLLAWICDHEDEAKELFPSYSTEEGQARLMTPKVTARIRREKQEFKKKCEELEATLKAKEEELEQLRKMNGSRQVSGAEMKEYDGDYGVVYAPGELGFDDDQELESFCRRVGEGGERYAMKYLMERYLDLGYTQTGSETADRSENSDIREISLEHVDGRSVTIRRADTGSHKQAGYDIEIFETASDKTERTVYVEVKTHTESSPQRRLLRLSSSQMVTAARYLGNFEILHVIWDRFAMNASGAQVFDNPIRCIADGRIINAYGDYLFRIA